MECPGCKHQASPGVLVRCSNCGLVFERQLLEEYEHLAYLKRWIITHSQQLGESAAALSAELDAREKELALQMQLKIEPVPEAPAPGKVIEPLVAEAVAPAEAFAPSERGIPAEVGPAPIPAPMPVPEPVPVTPAAPAAPARPARQPLNWGKVWNNAVGFVVSGALLRALLYMGAFMIVVSAAVLVINFWDIFPPILQGLFIFAVPTVFYAAGWLIRARLKLQQAGMVITGVGAILLAVDFIALYQFGNLKFELGLYWLFASLITTAVYAFTAYRLEGVFFDYLLLLGGTNILTALARVLSAPLEWTIAAIPLAGAGMAGLAANRWSRGAAWRDTAVAARYLPQFLIPLSLIAILFVGGAGGMAGKMAAFVWSAVAYSLLAWKFPAVHQLILALTSLTAATVFAVLWMDSSGVWLALAGAILSAGNILVGWQYFTREGASRSYLRVLYWSGLLLGLASLAGSLWMVALDKWLEAALPLTLLAGSACAWSLMLRLPRLGYIGAGLFLFPYYLWLDLAQVSANYYPLAYLLLISFLYFPAGWLVKRAAPKFAAPYNHLGWLVSVLVGIASVVPGTIFTYTLPWVAGLTLTLLAAYYAFNTWYFTRLWFAWGAALVLALAVAQWLVVAALPAEQSALAWSGLPFVYLLIDRILNRRKAQPWAQTRFRWPWGLGVILAGLGAWVFSIVAVTELRQLPERVPLTLVSQGMLVLLTILAARLYRSRWPLFVEPLLSAVLAMLFSVVYFPGLFGRTMQLEHLGLIYCGLGWLHLLCAAGMDRRVVRYSQGLYLGGYGLTALAVYLSATHSASLLWTLGGFILALSASAVWVHLKRHITWGEVVRLFGAPAGLPARLVRDAYLWLAAWLFPIWCGLLLVQINLLPAFCWLGLSLPALAYLASGNWLARREKSYAWPFYSAAHAYALVALLFSVDRVLLAGAQIAGQLSVPEIASDGLLPLLGQGSVQLATVTFYTAWAWMQRQRSFAHLAAWLSIPTFTTLLLCLRGLAAGLIVMAWMGWAMLLMLLAFLLDRPEPGLARHAHGPYLAGYVLAIFALIVSTAQQWLLIDVLGLCILAASASFIAVHKKRHGAFEDFIHFFWRKDTLMQRGARLIFLFFAAYALPFWVVQWEAFYKLSLAWQGVSLALLAPLYIAAGLYLRRLNRDYTWPFYSAGYAMTALGAMIAFDDQRLAIYVLLLDILVYAASSVIHRQPIWLYLATSLAPVTFLIALQYAALLTAHWISWGFTAMTFVYFGLGQIIERRSARSGGVAPFGMPFFAPAYLLSAIALAIVSASSDSTLALGVFLVNILLYALSAWRFREPLFLYPAVWLSVVPYNLIVTTWFSIPMHWQGLAWLPLILVFITLGRFVFHKHALDMKSPRAIFASLANPAMPFYLIAYALTVTMLLGSRWQPVSLTVAYAIVTLLYLASTFLFSHPAWLYPTIITAHLTVLAYYAIDPGDTPARMITIPFLGLTWIEALVGYLVSRRYPVTEVTASGRLVFKLFKRSFDFGAFPSIGHLVAPSWAQPIFIYVALDTLLWEVLALSSLDTGVWISAGFFLLYALLAMLWQDQLLAHLSIGFGVLSAAYQLRALGLTLLQTFAGLSGIAFGLYLFSWMAEWRKGLLAVWRRPLINSAIIISMIGILVTFPAIFSETISTAFALGFTGALYLTMSLRQRTYLLGYLGMGLLIGGWSLFLFVRNVEQPQLYAIPAGLYFVGMGFFERLRHPGRFAMLIESLGLAFLLVTSFVQSLSGASGFPYFLLLLVEALVVVWWGAARRLRVPFIIGLAASVINVLAQVVVLVMVYDVNRWVILFGVGILLVSLGLFVERRREILLARAQDLRDMLERWD